MPAEMRTVSADHCQVSVPADWQDSRIAGVGARSTQDRRFNAVVSEFANSQYQMAVDSMKQAHAKMVEDTASHILFTADFPGNHRQ